MNGKIKTKFAALFAVALMITVCVVPMVGNDYGEAETVVVPETSGSFTVEGTILDTGGYATSKVVEVSLTSGSTVMKTTTSNGKYSFTINSNSAVDLTIAVNTSSPKITVNGAEVDNPVCGMTIGSLIFTSVDGDIKDANMQIGYYAISGSIYYKDASTIANKGLTVSLMKKGKNDTVPDATVVSATASSGKFSILVPADTELGTNYSAYYLKATESVTAPSMTFTYKSEEFDTLSNSSGKKVIAQELYQGIITIPVTNSVLASLEVAIGKNTTTSIDYLSVPSVVPSATQGATYEYTLKANVTATQEDLLLSDTDGYGSVTGSEQKIGAAGGQYNLNVVYGKVTFLGKDYPGITLTFTDAQNNESSSAPTGDKGEYLAKKAGLATSGQLTITAKKDSVPVNLSTQPFNVSSGVQNVNVIADSTGYRLVTGNITGASPVINASIDASVVASGVGEVKLESNTTDKDGNYWFIAKNGYTYTVTPNATYSAALDAATKQIYVYADGQKVDFVMDTKEYKVTVEGPSGKLSNVDVYYCVDYTAKTSTEDAKGTFKSVKTGSNGVAKFKVNSNQDATKVFLYFNYNGYSFTAKGVNDAVAFNSTTTDSTELTVNTLEKKYNVSVIAGKTGVTNLIGDADASYLKVTAGKYDVVTIGGVSTYELKESYAVTYKDGVYSFITKETGLYLKIEENGGEYDYPLMNEISNVTSTIYAIEGEWNFTVTDAGTTPLSSINVEVYDASGDLIGKYVTDGVGKIYVLGAKPTDSAKFKVVASDSTGIYTFNKQELGTSLANVKANEKQYELNVVDDASKGIYNADITVQAIDSDGKNRNSAKVEANGKVKIVASSDSKLKLTDASGKYTFPEYAVTAPQLEADQATYTVTVEDAGDKAIVGAGVEVSLGNAADGYTVVVGDLVTDKDGKVEVFLTKPKTGDNYKAKVTYGMGLEKESNDVAFNTIIESDIYLREIAIKSAANVDIKEAGYLIKVLDNTTGKEVGTATTDSSGIARFYSAANATTFAVESPEGSPYTFETEVVTLAVADGVAKGTMNAEQTLYSGFVQSLNDEKLEGVTVTLKNAIGKVVGTGVTDKGGKYEIVAIGATGALASNVELAFGKFTFTKDVTSLETSDLDSFKTIEAKENLYSGYYADGAVVKDVEVSYMDDGVKSLAKVIDNKYFIVTKTDLVTANTKVTATAPNFNAVGTIATANAPLTVGDVPTYDVSFKPSMGAQILCPSDEIYYGTVLTLVAQNEYSIGVPEEDGVIQKYKFAGWYVNGDKVSDELIYAYTVEGDCTIYADYKVSSYVAAPADESNGLSMDVLVLGIVIVVLGLLAFAYAVKFKKE